MGILTALEKNASIIIQLTVASVFKVDFHYLQIIFLTVICLITTTIKHIYIYIYSAEMKIYLSGYAICLMSH